MRVSCIHSISSSRSGRVLSSLRIGLNPNPTCPSGTVLVFPSQISPKVGPVLFPSVYSFFSLSSFFLMAHPLTFHLGPTFMVKPRHSHLIITWSEWVPSSSRSSTLHPSHPGRALGVVSVVRSITLWMLLSRFPGFDAVPSSRT